MQNQAIVQGKIKITKGAGGAITALIVPFDDPGGWFIEAFPTQELAEIYAQQNLLVIEMENQNATEADHS